MVELEIVSRDYQEFATTRSRGFDQWILVDVNLDGKIDIVYKDYTIIACEDDDCINNYIIQPHYPEGFINNGWYNPSEEKSNERYNKEINYWMNTIWGEK